jgi:hypothetical protein
MIRSRLIRLLADETHKAELSRDLLFDSRYAKRRSVKIYDRPGQTVLRVLLQNLSEADRKSLFPGEFDMGSSRQPLELTTKAVLEELREEGRGEAMEHIRGIKEGIKKITGISFKTFSDQERCGALRVVKLLYILKTKNGVRIFSLLEPPGAEDKPSMEVKDAHPLVGNEGAVYVISDLKAFLALEIDSARLDEIDKAFDHLYERIDQITEKLIQREISVSGDDYDTLLRNLDTLHERLSVPKGDDFPKQITPLVETLYVHCYAVEFINFIKVIRFITTQLMPKNALVPIGSELRKLTQVIQGRQHVNTNDNCISASKFKDFVSQHESDICSALTKSTGKRVALKEIKRATEDAEKLIRLWAVFLHPRGILTLDKNFDVSPLDALAALASIIHELKEPTRYLPYRLGQKNDRGNVLSALRGVNLTSSETTVAEEYNAFWILRFSWFKYAIAGQLALLKRRQQVRECFFTTFERLVQSYDIKAIQDHVDGASIYSAQTVSSGISIAEENTIAYQQT